MLLLMSMEAFVALVKSCALVFQSCCRDLEHLFQQLSGASASWLTYTSTVDMQHANLLNWCTPANSCLPMQVADTH